MASSKLVLLLLCFVSGIRLSISGSKETNSMQSVPDLEKSIYMDVDGFPCVRLLNLSGEIGCSNPGRDKVVAPVVSFKNANDLVQSSAVLVSTDEFQSFFSRVLSDTDFSKNIAGVLVKSGPVLQNTSRGFSPARKFPQAEFAPYQNVNYEWNPIGSGILWNTYNFPVYLLSESSSVSLQEVAFKNEKRKKAYIMDVAEFDMVMQTTKVGTLDSESCLKEETCLPLGGYRAVFGRHFHQLISHYQNSPGLLY